MIIFSRPAQSRLQRRPRFVGSLARLWRFTQMLVTAILAGTVYCAHAQANEWTWMGGSDAMHQAGVYGMMGEPAFGNIPGGRTGSTQWLDKNGNLWIFGGYGFNAGIYGQGPLNDLWEFNPSTNEWAWMDGSSVNNSEKVCGDQIICGPPPVYGTLGVPAPGTRG